MAARHSERIIARAVALRAEGTSYPHMQRILGVPRTTLVRWCNPKYAERQRVASNARKPLYGGNCERCGERTSHGNGQHPGPAKHCAACAIVITRENAFWTREALLDAARQWAAIYGHAPSASEWRNADRSFPHPSSRDCYGQGAYGRREGWATWNEYLRTAGLTPRRVGEHIQREAVAA